MTPPTNQVEYAVTRNPNTITRNERK